MLQEDNLDWFPHLRAMSLVEEEEDKSGVNEVQNINERIASINKMASQLSQQMQEIKEQMNLWKPSIEWQLLCSDLWMKEMSSVKSIIFGDNKISWKCDYKASRGLDGLHICLMSLLGLQKKGTCFTNHEDSAKRVDQIYF